MAGFYATPEDQTARIAGMLRVEEYEDPVYDKMHLAVLDPCAGEGVAVEQITRAIAAPIEAAKKREEAKRRARYQEESRQRKVERVKRAEERIARARDMLALCSDHTAQDRREKVRREREVALATSELNYARKDAGMDALPVEPVAETAAVEVLPKNGARVRRASGPRDLLGTVRRAHDASGSCATCVGETAHAVVVWDDGEDEFDEDTEDLVVVDALGDAIDGEVESEPDPSEEEIPEEDPVEDPGEEGDDAVPVVREITCADVYTCEMEEGRHERLSIRPGLGYRSRHRALHGDAFRIAFTAPKSGGVGLLHLNPPYDLDKVHGRLEERWLRRFTDALAPGGVLDFVVPHYALAASARTFATHYEDLACYRFSGESFDVYKQVVLFAKKLHVPRLDPDPEIVAQVEAWAARGQECPELPEAGRSHRRPRYVVPLLDGHAEALENWQVKPVDAASILAEYRPWCETKRQGLTPSRLVVPEFPLSEVMHRTYEVATAPRPAHIAAGLAAGLFNGQRVEPDDTESKLPPLLVKGVFDREWRTVEEKHGKEGEKTGEVQVQAPRLVVTVLDLESSTYHTLAQDAEAKSAVPRSAADLSVGDLLKHYGRSLLAVMLRQCVVLYDPRRDAGRFDLVDGAAPLYDAQAHAARAIVSVIADRGDVRQPPLLGEIGCLRGDTLIYDPVVGDTVAVDERCRRAEPFHVWALSPSGEPVVAAALPPVRYPVAQMVKITMDDGSSIVVTPSHQFWNGLGWIKASEVASAIVQQRGSSPYLLPSNSDTDLRVRARDGSRWSRTTPSSRDDCPPDLRSCGERLPLEGDSDRGLVPSRGGARGRTRSDSRGGGLVRERARNRSCQSGDHLATNGFESRKVVPHLELFLPLRGSHLSNASSSSRGRRRSPEGTFPARTSGGRGVVSPVSTSVSVASGTEESFLPSRESAVHTSRSRSASTSLLVGSSTHSRKGDALQLDVPVSNASGVDYNVSQMDVKSVVSVEAVDAENYYDFHVPVFNNYWAMGLWHHNCGKSRTSLVAARTYLERVAKLRRPGRVLVFCPPHLLDSWKNEVAALYPDADFRVIASPSDVDAVAGADKFTVAVVSREGAKLGHRLEGVSGFCPRCAEPVGDAEELAKKRSRCGHQPILPANDYAEIALDLSLRLRPWRAEKVYRSQRLRSGYVAKRRERFNLPPAEAPTYAGLPAETLAGARKMLIRDCERAGHDSPVWDALVWSLAAGGLDPAEILAAARARVPKYQDYQHRAESLLLLLPPGGALGAAYEVLDTFPKPSYAGETSVAWFKREYAKLRGGVVPKDSDDPDETKASQGGGRFVTVGRGVHARVDDGKLLLDGHAPGSIECAANLLREVSRMATWSRGPECGEHLYQSVPEPRRYPLAKYISKRAKNTFDFVILDEAHEASSSDAAQSVAAHRLTNLGLPTIFMTGSIMNGYAESLHTNWWATDKEFREEFGRREISAFVDRYGYKKRLVQDKEEGKVVAYGSQSDRVERSERDIGSAPGVLPLFIFKHLLRGAVTLHKSDLRLDLPKLTQERVSASASGELLEEFDRIRKALSEQIKADRFDEVLAGKLFGQLAELPSYLDRATVDVGNGRGGDFEIRYPESVGGDLVAAGRLFPADTVLPKESLMLDVVQREVGEGRRVMVHGWHLELLPRLARLLQERIGEDVPVLYADKVPTAKRQKWIDDKIVKKKVRVMVCNPVCIQTGLNNLTWFHTIWQHENPACNPIVDRQSIGRIDRIGQKKETRVFRAYYGDTLQEKMHDLLMSKVAISTATDGLDPESAMLAAGVERDTFVTGLSLGKALWAMMEEGALEERPTLRVVRGGKRR